MAWKAQSKLRIGNGFAISEGPEWGGKPILFFANRQDLPHVSGIASIPPDTGGRARFFEKDHNDFKKLCRKHFTIDDNSFHLVNHDRIAFAALEDIQAELRAGRKRAFGLKTHSAFEEFAVIQTRVRRWVFVWMIAISSAQG